MSIWEYMVLPSDGKVEDEKSSNADVDEDIDALLNEDQHEPDQNVNTISEIFNLEILKIQMVLRISNSPPPITFCPTPYSGGST